MNDEKLEQLVDAMQLLTQNQAQLAADTAALTAVVRSLADANADNPQFALALKSHVEPRIVLQLNSGMTEDAIDAFSRVVKALLPQKLRDR